MAITAFNGQDMFLSNFYPSAIRMDLMLWPTAEHAYQACKAANPAGVSAVHGCKTASQAKMMGRRIAIRPGWDEMKIEIMLKVLRKKFAIASLRQRLIDTGPLQIIEGNHWNDTFWGVCNGKGENHLGKLLMQVRDECIEADIVKVTSK